MLVNEELFQSRYDNLNAAQREAVDTIYGPVSYTHLDVYKRQLEKLISQTENKIQHKQAKLEDARKQVAENPEGLVTDNSKEADA